MIAEHRLHAELLGDPDVTGRFDGRAQLQAMLDVEAALAEAEAAVGVVPAACVPPIKAAADADLYDRARLAEEAADAGNPVIPVVHHLTERVAAADPDAARYVHWGATSQDIMDTGLVLQLRAAVPAVAGHLGRAERAAAGLARRHAGATMAGRTWLQQATPITFGLKAAGWADALGRTRRQVEAALHRTCVLQLGGAAGTLAALGTRGLAVTDALAARLDLRAAATPWHAHRDRFAQLACALGIASGTAGKVARDLSLLAQTEVGEVAEGTAAGRGGSSTMPQKRNPVSASVALAAAGRTPGLVATILGAMLQEHERGLGGWQVEWDVLPEVVLVTAGGTRATAAALEGLSVDTDRMRANLDASGGALLAEAVAMALGESIGKHEAHTCIAAACRRAADERRPLVDVLAEDSTVGRRFDRAELEKRLSPDRYLGVSRDFIERALAGEGDDA